jgi:hypothetical protein
VTNIEELKAIILKLHGAEATHRESVPVKEVWQGQTVWDGVVEVFDLEGHPDANTAYAWSHETDEGTKRHVAVLHIPPVVDAITAVRAAFMRDYYAQA